MDKRVADAKSQLTQVQIDDAREWFDECDTDGGGSLDEKEVFVAMHKLYGPQVTREMVSKIFKDIDADGSGDVDFDEFLVFVAEGNSQDSAGAFGAALLGGGSGVDKWAPTPLTTVCPDNVAAGKTGQLRLEGDLLHVRWPTDAIPGSQAKLVLGENAFRVLLDKPGPKKGHKEKGKSKKELEKEAKAQRKAEEQRLGAMREELEAKLEAQEEKERADEDDMPDDQREKREEQREQRRVEVLGKLEATRQPQEVPPLAAPDESAGSEPTGDDAADADGNGDEAVVDVELQQGEAANGSSVSSFFGFGDAAPQVEPDPPAPPIAADATSGSSFFGLFGGGEPEPPKIEEPPAAVAPPPAGSQPAPAAPKFDVNTGLPIPAAPKFDVNTGLPIPTGPKFDVNTGLPIPKFDVHTGKQNW